MKTALVTEINDEIKLFHETVDKLISLNKSNRNRFRGQPYKDIGPAIFAHEHQSVRCDIGRRTGKTLYILNSAKKNDLIIVYNMRMLEQYKAMLRCKVVLPQNLESLEDEYFDTIYIDEPEIVFKAIDINKLFKTLAKDIEQTFVFIGF